MLNIDWKPQRNSSTALYRQIVDYIKEKIGNGEWTVGTRLPVQRELAKIFEVNRSTVIEALDELKADGLIEGRGKKGTVIINNTWSLMASTPAGNWEHYIKNGIQQPNLPTIQIINKLEYSDNIIRLGTGELSPELFPEEMMKNVFSTISNKIKSLGYERPKGLLYLREIISQHIKKFHINASPSSILIVSGSLQALQLISMSILKPGSTVLVEKPSYIKSLHVFESWGTKLKGISMDKDGVKLNEILKNLDNTTSLLYTIPTFNNPTGTIMSQDRRDDLLNLCTRERLPIIEDDAYRELWMEEIPPDTLKSRDKNGIVLYMNTLSKSLAPGMRIGWVIGPEAVIERLGDVKMQTDYGASSISQYAAAEWIKSGLYEAYLKKLRRKLKLRRDITIKILEKYFSDIALWNIPKGSFYIWMRLNSKINMTKLFYRCCKNGILINPGYMYDFNTNYNIRISYSYASIQDLQFGLKKLSDIIRNSHFDLE
ncbi:PLP-dependent aminotransferase family protein [Clostridium sp. MT-14]|uniref:PLP-dependent aminotransferase family protein n=1 Tax=Clostridium aromativorans TaxID=2836848 RepID=A0ABS8N652_9CLOT|nr:MULTISPECIES: PLP-dependent aminotransferase family protein [Clostridium]KAA8680546.1 PLP-dependent aminotransferase family protein [Clostridium sp. HV4-5-A1G]MCC9295272.1 PLP-dependent aminotransferase family protein [Clostridium aromativorans]CAB1261847.1 putative PLP-dependent transcriptional regulator [Clostridiaceae bacterium BL-3]